MLIDAGGPRGGNGSPAAATIVSGDQSPGVGAWLGVDTTSAACSVQLPSYVVDHDLIVLEDPYGSWAAHSVTVIPPEGCTILGAATLVLDVPARVTLIADTGAGDWRIKELTGLHHS